ncbi:PTS sugar transporter subunit IIB [Paenibacillus hemerocallicola]|uniref:PTS sugar transporter subunit IIB n=1 Tax=Paenibacillus hemerocallicola TaxID=1172614 RepID=A0A5C4TF70_9BACL|nr:PTS sugar transporter subunit IIB [Paenibacillus hemerocallicola]TNJ67784.1 PTS sugar transporter subunit IIB [Paenibacillus hemerocallicola]
MKVVTVCGMGFGTSLMLLMDIQEMAAKHGIKVEGEAVDLGSAKGKSCDLMVASSEIAGELSEESVQVIAINNLLDKNELQDKVLPVLQAIIAGKDK